MQLTENTWAFVITLAAVINGLGIVLLISGIGDYLKNHSRVNLQHYWVYTLLAIFQLLAHLLLWWSILGVVTTVDYINFLVYLYLLIGPALLYLGTSLIVPNLKDKSIDLRTEYYHFRKTYYSIMIVFWLWVISIWPAFGYQFPPNTPLLTAWLFISLILRLTDNQKAHATLVTTSLVVYVMYIVIFAMKIGEVSRRVVE